MSRLKKGEVLLSGTKPMVFRPDRGADVTEPTKAQKTSMRRVGKTVKAYVGAVKELLAGKYAGIRHMVPTYIDSPGNVLACVCEDGIVIRFEANDDAKTKVFTGWMDGPLAEVVPLLSQNLIHCYATQDFESTAEGHGTELTLSKVEGATGKTEEILSLKIGFDAVIERPERLPEPPSKPYSLFSVRNEFEIQLHGIEFPSDGTIEKGHRFIARTTIRLPVGWECIEVYPFVDFSHWDPKWAPVWAENDILGAVVAAQQRERHLESLDPHATAREGLSRILDEYRNLLDEPPRNEEVLQLFMKEHPELLCPAKNRVWPKLRLGPHVTDFVFREAAGDYLLVELEPSTERLFRRKGGHPLARLRHAQSQVTDWRRYIESNLDTVQRELGLSGISTNPKSLIVIGRSDSLTDENRRFLVTLENENPKMKIMTYDDVYDNAKALIENWFGPSPRTEGRTQILYPPTSR